MPSPTSFCDMPAEVIEQVVLAATSQSVLGPPQELRVVLLCCRHLHHILSAVSFPRLYASIYAQKFPDAQLIAAHVPHADTVKLFVVELQSRLSMMQVFRQVLNTPLLADGLRDPRLPAAFQTAYYMMCLDRANAAQLRWAGVYDVSIAWLCLLGSDPSREWPEESGTRMAVTALAWLLSTGADLAAESIEDQERILRSLEPFLLSSFRYPLAAHPEHCFDVTLDPDADCHLGAPAPQPPHPPRSRNFCQLPSSSYVPDSAPQPTCCARIAPFAIASYVARSELTPLQVYPMLPKTRADAMQHGHSGPTQEDIIRYNQGCRLRTTAAASHCTAGGCAPVHDLSVSTPYVLGTLTGMWEGSALVPCADFYQRMVASKGMPSPFARPLRQPAYCAVREYYCYSPTKLVPAPDPQDGFSNGWLPRDCRWQETPDGLDLWDIGHHWKTHYTSYAPQGLDKATLTPLTRGVTDVIVIGESGEHGRMWGAYRFFGRVRLADGLVTLIREPSNPAESDLGRWVMRGYVLDSRSWVGRWTPSSTGLRPSEYDVAFRLCKGEVDV